MDTELHPALLATGRFKVRSCLGSGSFGVVYDVHDAAADAPVALKWLRSGESATLARFKREFRALADLIHPNLVGYRELFAVGGEWFFTMELVEGVEFTQYIRTSGIAQAASDAASDGGGTTSADIVVRSTLALSAPGGLPLPSAAPKEAPSIEPRKPCLADLRRLRSCLSQLGAGLDALHAAGMIHRDVKPSNVLVTHTGRVVLLDLGLVTDLGRDGVDMSKSGVIVGTPAFMSPEQALAHRCGPASDWYSVGVMLYQALTGRLPFEGTAHAQLMKKQLETPRSPSSFVTGIPKELSDLCLALLARSPEERPTGAAFSAWLERAFADVEPPSMPLSTIRRDSPAYRSSEVPSPRILSSAPGDLVGRERHLDLLRSAYEDSSARGKAVIAFVAGKSGMGKTALVRGFLEDLKANRRDALVLEGRCYERESVPFHALDALVDSLCRWLARLPDVESAKLLPRDVEALARVFPVLSQISVPSRKRARGPVDVLEERRRAFEAMRELLSRLCDRGPLVLFIDDFQWGDADSEPLFSTILRLPDPPPLLLVAAYRAEDAETAPLVRALRKAATAAPGAAPQIEAREVPVGELDDDAARALATTLLEGRATPALAAAIAAESFGSPLFLRQLAALDTGAARVDLTTAITAQVKALPADARRLLEVFAVAERALSAPAAARIAGIEQDPQPLVARLRAENLVRTRGAEASGEVEVYHGRIRDIVVGGLPAEEARELHRKIGRTLATGGDDHAEAVARHYQLANEAELAAEYAERAADRATSALAFGRAATMYEMALGLSSSIGRGAESLLLKLAEALTLAGRGREAAERFLEAAQTASPVDALDLRRRAAEQMLFSGHVYDGLVIIEQILDVMKMRSSTTPLGVLFSLLWRRFLLALRGIEFKERSVDQIPRAELVRIDTCYSLGMGLGTVDPVRGADYQTRYLLLALAAGEPQRIARGLALEAVYRASDGSKQRAVVERLLARGMSLADREAQPATSARMRLLKGATCFLMGDFRRAFDVCDEAMTLFREKCVGVSWDIDNAAFLSGLSLIALGRIRELAERLPVQLDDARARGNMYAQTILRMQCGWFVNLARDDADAARADLAALSDDWSRGRVLLQQIWQSVNGADVELYEGAPLEAWRIMEGSWSRLRRHLFMRAEGVRVLMCDARGRAALGAARATEDAARRAELLAVARKQVKALRREPFPSARGQRLLLEAGIAHLEGDAKVCTERLRDAAAALEAHEIMLFAIAARYRLGELLGAAEGEAMRAKAEDELRARAIARPEKMVRVFAPFMA